MKKLFVTLAITSLTAGAFAQATLGRVAFINSQGATKTPIYNVDKSDSTLTTLNTANRDLLTKGTSYSVELFWAMGGNASEGSLVAAPSHDTSLNPISTFAANGFFKGNSNFDILGTAGGDTVTLQLRVWDNKGGSITTWDQVLADNSIARGKSSLITNVGLGGSDVNNVAHANGTILGGFSSFGLYTLPVVIPEPSVIAIGALGLGALVLRRRK